VKFTLRLENRRIAVRGLGALLGIALLLALPNLLAAPLPDDRAEAEVRSYLERQLSQRQVAQLHADGLTAPTVEMARRWQIERDRLELLEFSSLDVRSFLFTPPLVSSCLYVVRVELRFPDEDPETRFFSLTVDSRLSDFFWADEKPALLWYLAR